MVSSQIKRNTELLERKEITRDTYKESEGEGQGGKEKRGEQKKGEERKAIDCTLLGV